MEKFYFTGQASMYLLKVSKFVLDYFILNLFLIRSDAKKATIKKFNSKSGLNFRLLLNKE